MVIVGLIDILINGICLVLIMNQGSYNNNSEKIGNYIIRGIFIFNMAIGLALMGGM